jgi:hypothetical protein
MKIALNLLNRVLEKSEPGTTVCLTPRQAQILSQLSRRELGPLADSIEQMGPEQALEQEGLFGREIVIDAECEERMTAAA